MIGERLFYFRSKPTYRIRKGVMIGEKQIDSAASHYIGSRSNKKEPRRGSFFRFHFMSIHIPVSRISESGTDL